jgi:beta-lactamase class A
MLDTAAAKAGRDNLTTAADTLLLLRAIERGQLTGAEPAQELLDAMRQNVEHSKLPALLPPDVVVAHKTGVLDRIEHDAGIVNLPDGRRYLIVVLSKDLPNNQRGIDAIAQVSKIVYDWYDH